MFQLLNRSKTLKLSLLLVTMLMTSGMTCTDLREDPVMDTISANYPSAEMRVQGRLAHGIGFCEIEKGKPLSDCDIRLQAYYKGMVQASGEGACPIDERVEYRKSGLIQFSLHGSALENCVVTLTVEPQFPKPDDQAIRIHSFKGHVFVKVLEKDENHIAYKTRVREDLDSRILIPSLIDNPNVRVTGCGMPFEEKLFATNGYVRFRVSDILKKKIGKRNCIFHGVVEDDENPTYFTWAVFGYDKSFEPLSDPLIESPNGRRVKIYANTAVTIVSLDDSYKIGNEAEFWIDPDIEHTLRILTHKGRSQLWDYDPGLFGWIKVGDTQPAIVIKWRF